MENAPNDSAPQVETAAASPSPAPTSAATATEAPASPLSSFDDDQIEASFQARNEPPPAEPAAEPIVNTDEPVPAAPEPPTEPAPPPEPAQPDEPDQTRVRLKGEDATIARISKEKGISIAEAADLYRGKPAAAATPAPSEQPPQASPVQAQETRVADLQRQLEEAEANEEVHGSDYHKLNRQFMQESNRLDLLRFQETQTAAERQRGEAQAAERAVATSVDAARAEFPAVGETNSPLYQAVFAVEAEWQANPATAARLERPDAPLMLAREAAERVATTLVNAGKFRTLDLALASLKAAPTARAAATVPPAPTLPVAPQQQSVRRVAPAPGTRTQTQPVEPPNSTALLSQVGFDPDAANEALYGNNRITALGGR